MKQEEVIIIGGGLAGLTAAIHLAKSGCSVTLFEKEAFPRHKVCGEYVSKEILPYFERLEIPLASLSPAEISRFQYSTCQGKSIEAALPMGGLGVSRYAFDDLLFKQALDNGVDFIQERVDSVKFIDGSFQVKTLKGKLFSAKVALGAYGKRSNLDKSLARTFIQSPSPWMAAKAHYEHDHFPDDLVALHNFPGGYCGLSRTETGAVNLCYLTRTEVFRAYKAPKLFEKEVLRHNPMLLTFLNQADPVFKKPLSIAQVCFRRKSLVEERMLLLGDAAGLLHPLCGNGMAMAIHSAKIASELVLQRLTGELDQRTLEENYRKKWRRNFKKRVELGRWLQQAMVSKTASKISLSFMSHFPKVVPQIIKRTHGAPII